MKIRMDAGWRDLPPGGIIDEAGTAVEFKTGDWRAQRPVWHADRCTHCLQCWIYCPDSAVLVADEKCLGPDYDYCKGCGICAQICPPKAHAIEMVGEGKEG